MPVHPYKTASTPQGRILQAIGDLQREVRQIREARAGGIQRASSLGNPGLTNSSATTPQTLASVDLNIPSGDSLLLVWWFFANLQVSVNTTTVRVIFQEPTDIPDATDYLLVDSTNAASSEQAKSAFVLDTTPSQSSGSAGGARLHQTMQVIPSGLVTAGDRTYSLKAYRQAGAGTWTATGVNLIVAVV